MKWARSKIAVCFLIVAMLSAFPLGRSNTTIAILSVFSSPRAYACELPDPPDCSRERRALERAQARVEEAEQAYSAAKAAYIAAIVALAAAIVACALSVKPACFLAIVLGYVKHAATLAYAAAGAALLDALTAKTAAVHALTACLAR